MKAEEQSAVESSPLAADLDWSQIRETVRMLDLAVAQIAMAMHEGEDSVEALSASFGGMAGRVASIRDLAMAESNGSKSNGAKSNCSEAVPAEIVTECDAMQADINTSIVAFQFYDRLSQRLDHVRFVLDALAELVNDPSRVYDPGQWQSLQQDIRGRYTMQEEQQMFDVLLKGAGIEEALDLVREKVHHGDINDIELF